MLIVPFELFWRITNNTSTCLNGNCLTPWSSSEIRSHSSSVICISSDWTTPMILVYGFRGRVTWLLLRPGNELQSSWWKKGLTYPPSHIQQVLIIYTNYKPCFRRCVCGINPEPMVIYFSFTDEGKLNQFVCEIVPTATGVAHMENSENWTT